MLALVLDHDSTCSLGGISSESLLLRLARLPGYHCRPIYRHADTSRYVEMRSLWKVKLTIDMASSLRAVRKFVVSELAFTHTDIGRTDRYSSVSCKHRRIVGRGYHMASLVLKSYRREASCHRLGLCRSCQCSHGGIELER